ncbi:TetR/AcrR family transcriptional regulator [Echinimonas agarilytica]|uniref:TetR/AcrR family transcriptional regulator n=1 Tax=Echinimonas agarilytica TaxID=1215918 RepID=A0AA41W7D8_9GAMM|nr:TetR/AcrR family transcriptional regulator [Echinimonas agarilytica]MCM2680344.1 TetR/AcrR family transcriptional regulator [Echinimonas agarilytica]
MPNPKRFDREDVTQKAKELFWRQGYHATSMRDLSAELDMRPASIYAEFGNKDGIFIEAITAYQNEMELRFHQALDSTDCGLDALRTFIQSVSIGNQHQAARACMLAKTLLEIEDHEHRARQAAQAYIESFQGALCGLINSIQDAGEIDRSLAPNDVATFVQVQLMGLRSASQMGLSNEQLQHQLDWCMASIATLTHCE